MKYLMCLDENGISSYTELKMGQEVRLTNLIREKKLPPFFTLNGDKIISKDILGFTDDKVSIADQTSTKDGYERYRQSVLNSAWYLKAKGRKTPAISSQPSPVTLLP